ncbi:MAG: hypothetical protein EU539_06985 [Promethearchaeota archaeon]|nr:MAG: hypothetical protein EU539_06985 [Candidatus Lokiarchaeota archaeon]
MEVSPGQIYEDYINGKLDKISVIDQLISIIENSETANIRIKSLEILMMIGSRIELKDERTFTLFENLLISDSNTTVRNLAANGIRTLFLEKAFAPMKWAYQHETSIGCLTTIISTLGQLKQDEAKSFLIEIINKIENYQFRKSLKEFFENKGLQNLSNDILAEIVNNYMVIKYFIKKFSRINFKVEKGFVMELDLSCISSNLLGLKILKNLPEFISVLRCLTKLDLKINRITTLPTSIGSFYNLKYLDLSNNKLKTLPNSFGSLNSLQHLYLRYNNLKKIPSSICSLKTLKVLDLRHNKLISLPEDLTNLTSLEVLDLHGNKIDRLPETIKDLSSLQNLQLGLNNLRFLPDWMEDLKSLKILGLGANKSISNFHQSLGLLPSLVELDLYDNNIKELPDTIGLLTSLETLTLRNNQLTDLPRSFQNLKKLKKLNLSWNNFTRLPTWIGNLNSLEELNLWGNKLDSLPNSIGFLKSLKILNLNFNKYMKKLPESIKQLQNDGLVIFQ